MRIEGNDAEDSGGADQLALVYAELRVLARKAMARQPPGQTLQTTALLNEAWIRLEHAEGAGWENHDHFLAVAARAMRSVLVDHARKRGALKRGAVRANVELDQIVDALQERSSDLLVLDEALDDLKADETLARVVELRFFGGLKHPDIAKVLDLPLRRVERNWQTARAWLHARLAPNEDGGR